MTKNINKNFKYVLLSAVILVAAQIHSWAAFKNIGWSARSAGMGTAYTAISDDASGILFNPAGIVQAEENEINLMYAKLFAGLDEVDLGLKYGAFLFPTKTGGTFGFNWANFTSDGKYQEDIITISYARKLNELIKYYCKQRLVPEISLGINVKYLVHSYTLDERAKIDPVFENNNSKGDVSVDLGMLVKPSPKAFPGLTTGLVFKNINYPDVGLKTKDSVPMEIVYGLAYKASKILALSDVLTSIDVSYRNQEWGNDEDKINVHVGMEAWTINKMVALRLGGNYTEVSAGFGVRVPEGFGLKLKLDYAFLFPFHIQESMGTHRVSLSYSFLRAI